MWSETEIGFRRKRYDQIVAEWQTADGPALMAESVEERLRLTPEIRPVVEGFVEGRVTAQDLKDQIDSWTRGKKTFGFGGMAGAMFLNQLVKDSEKGEAESILRDAFSIPNDLEQARRKVNALAEFAQTLRDRGSSSRVGSSTRSCSSCDPSGQQHARVARRQHAWLAQPIAVPADWSRGADPTQNIRVRPALHTESMW